MKAMLWTRYGSPDGMQLREVQTPLPGDDELLVKIRAASVTAGDCEMRRLQLPLMLSFPMRLYAGFRKPKRIRILGQEFSGVVERVGKHVRSFQVGDEVFGTTGFGFGAYAEYLCLRGEPGVMQGVLAVKPANLSHCEAAAVPTAGLEALHYLRRAGIKPGHRVLIIGAGGSIGTAVIQLAKSMGAEVSAVDAPQKLERLRALGADHAIDYTREDYLMGHAAYDIIIDVVGRHSVARRLRLLKPGGMYFLAFARFSDLFLKPWVLLTGGKRLLIESSSQSGEDLLHLKNLIEQGKWKPVIDKSFPLEQTADAHRYAESGQKVGNIVITMAEHGEES